MLVDKSGGDAINAGEQYAGSNADADNAAVGGLGALAGVGGSALAQAKAKSLVSQYLDQHATGGDGGDDNVQSNTNINFS
ncbi:MAG: hypothetical protein ACR2RB_11260 [Gammaproteobacteria bacterium]